jgi:hypothetical protein
VLEKYDTEAEGHLRKASNAAASGVPVPTSIKQPELFGAYLAECVASLAKIVDERLSPKRRGRPPKTQ